MARPRKRPASGQVIPAREGVERPEFPRGSFPEGDSGAEITVTPPGVTAEPPRDPAFDDFAAYRKAFGVMDPDRVHDVLAKPGLRKILHKDAAYLIACARNARNKGYKRERRRREQLEEHQGRSGPPVPEDPIRVLEREERLRFTLEALADLSEVDRIIVWSFAEGFKDPEIRKELEEKLPSGEVPTEAAIRKRRERLRNKLRGVLESRGVELGD